MIENCVLCSAELHEPVNVSADEFTVLCESCAWDDVTGNDFE